MKTALLHERQQVKKYSRKLIDEYTSIHELVDSQGKVILSIPVLSRQDKEINVLVMKNEFLPLGLTVYEHNDFCLEGLQLHAFNPEIIRP